MAFKIIGSGNWKQGEVTPCVVFGSEAHPRAEEIGGKGAKLSEMTRIGFPVPPGFSIRVDACINYQKKPKWTLVRLKKPIRAELAALKKKLGYAPLLSIRSGARVSMPGMMDTILNVGITPDTFGAYAKRYGVRVALDCFRTI